MVLNEEIKAYIQAHAQEAKELLKELAQIPAPSNKEEKRMEFCKNWLIQCGAKGIYTDAALNVVYPYELTENKPVIVFMAHMDVVFPDETPLPWKEENGRLCCPGVGDDTANLVALMMAARYVTEKKLKPVDCGILFVCNAGEEGLGNLKGSRKICEDYKGRIQRFYSFDGTMKFLTSRAVGSERMRVTLRTEGGHSYGDFGRENAIANLAEIITEIYKIQVPEKGKTTYNAGIIEGGTSVNTIAQEASMLCEYRSDDVDSLAFMRESFNKIFQFPREGVEMQVETIGIRPCEKFTEEQAKERQKLLEETKALMTEITGHEPELSPGSTDCNIPLSMGIPSVCYGTYYGAGAHTREEYVEENSLKMGYEMAFASILKYTTGVIEG